MRAIRTSGSIVVVDFRGGMDAAFCQEVAAARLGDDPIDVAGPPTSNAGGSGAARFTGCGRRS
jgi:hypothetical protein